MSRYRVSIKALYLAIFFIFIAINGDTLDYPHSDVNNIGCNSCHFVFGSEASLLLEGLNYDQNIDDTQYNALCWSCHNDIQAPYKRTHSSLQIDNGYGDWSVECRTCHNPHSQRQIKQYGDSSYVDSGISTNIVMDQPEAGKSQLVKDAAGWTANQFATYVSGDIYYVLIPDTSNKKVGYKILSNSSNTIEVEGTVSDTLIGKTFAIIYGKLINNTIDLDEIIGIVKTGEKTVRFFDSTGDNSFADGDMAYDGICEVCHTDTAFHKDDGSGSSHNAGQRCTNCHKHTEGFKGSGCDNCHGYPPTVDAATGGPNGLVNYGGGVTGSEYAGAHDKHVNTKEFDCAVCHYESVGEGPLHDMTAPNEVTIGFSIFGELGGIYDGQSAVEYDSSDVNTTVLNGNSRTCDTIYCHSNAAPFDGVNLHKSVVWNGSVTCSSCHDEGGLATELSGRHDKHTNAAKHAVACEKCHDQTATGSSSIKNESYHVNNTKDIIFSAGGTYNSGTNACTNTYCHSDAAGGDPFLSIKWTDSVTLECYSCHRGRTADLTETNCTGIGGEWDSDGSFCTASDSATCSNIGGKWDAANSICTGSYLTMTTNGHERLTGSQWIRKYPCYYCHDDTVDESSDIKDYSKHANETKDIVIDSEWYIAGNDDPSYDSAAKECDNIYCHSDGTTVNPEVRLFAWTEDHAKCNTCHGHPNNNCSDCHNDGRSVWPVAEEWKSAMPMYTNTGAGTARANTHPRHMQTDFSCDNCHLLTITSQSCDTAGCHTGSGSMGENEHIDPDYHVNKIKDVSFKDGGGYDTVNKTCSTTACHTDHVPKWGDSVNNLVLCFECHGSEVSDTDDFTVFNDTRAKINMNEWEDTGHGRTAASGDYDSGNPPADFPGNPCWYCHDNDVLHNDSTNPFRLQKHEQFERRFDKECVYCHMEVLNTECLECHDSTGSLATQLSELRVTYPGTAHLAANDCLSCHDTDDGYFYDSGTDGCNSLQCHTADEGYEDTPGFGHQKRHNTGAGVWTPAEKADVQNQYVMMGVCLVCHDDDSNNRCNSCHTGEQYQLGFDPGTGHISGTTKATSVHFGYKHYAAYENDGVWKGGKFCWDCHDPHGDSNLYMIQDKVATETDGTFGIPVTRRDVVFDTVPQNGLAYAKSSAPFNGICNVCHEEEGQHYRFDYGNGHNEGRICTSCHEHRFSDSHASGKACNTCHKDKPIPRHSGFGQPRDCTKCHTGALNNRMDVMGQLESDSHHIQGVTVTNKHCYACHWESTEVGLIDVDYHAGYNYKVTPPVSTKDAAVDLVIWAPGARPEKYVTTSSVVKHNGTKYTSLRSNTSAASSEPGAGAEWETYWSDDGAQAGTEDAWALSTVYETKTVETFTANKVGTGEERAEVGKVTSHCLGCHSDQNNDAEPFNIVDEDNGDCKTPRQYAWDRTSIAARYSQSGTTTWGKYTGTANASKRDLTKAFSAHGNAEQNEGGFDVTNGLDSTITSTREGSQNVQCFDCHSSHGSKTSGVTSSYKTFNDSYNGGNLKETVAGKGGYTVTYKAIANDEVDPVNPYNVGAAQCFDCHETAAAGTETSSERYSPWGYNDTFGATEPIIGYQDSSRFGDGSSASKDRFTYRASKTTLGGHLSASSDLKGLDGTPGTGDEAEGTINGLCTPCHDPHGVSPSLGDNQQYAVPLLKGTWMTSPYKEDAPNTKASGSGAANIPGWKTDRNTFGGSRISEDDSQFAGLCLKCHPKDNLTDGDIQNTTFKTMDRVHESVKDWGNNAEHSYSCSKCHQPHSSGLPRLLQTNCLDSKHRGRVTSGGAIANKSICNGEWWGFPKGNTKTLINCHKNSFGLSDERWNGVTPW